MSSTVIRFQRITDLNPDTPGPYKKAIAFVYYRSTRKGTRIKIVAFNVDRSANQYPVHLHNGTCGNLGGHYQDQVDGAVDAVNEAWPTLYRRGLWFTGKSRNSWMVRSSDAVSVGFHPVSGGPVGCVGL